MHIPHYSINNQKNNQMTKKDQLHWSRFIASQQWHIYGTTTYLNPKSSNQNRRIMETTFNSIPSINQMFYVSEPIESNFNVHSHFLAQCNDINKALKQLRCKFRSYGRFKIDLISSTSNFLNEDGHLKVGYYITKSLSTDIDYDILIK
jgi:hypothetical protein